jgi:hypothetical protein
MSSTSGAFTAYDTSSAVITPGAVHTRLINPVRGISANVTLGLYTLNLAIRGKWQGSTDGSTWVDYVPMNNAANVTMQSSTGTTTISVVAPDAVLGKPFVRMGLYIVGGSTGTASDTYTASYSYASNEGYLE